MIKYILKVIKKRGILWTFKWGLYAYYFIPKWEREHKDSPAVLPVWFWEYQPNSKYYDVGLREKKIIEVDQKPCKGLTKKQKKKRNKEQKIEQEECADMCI